MIQVYRFEDAPEDLRELADQGGDEDWLVLIAAAEVESLLEYGLPRWIEVMDSCRQPVRIDRPNGDVIFVGCH